MAGMRLGAAPRAMSSESKMVTLLVFHTSKLCGEWVSRRPPSPNRRHCIMHRCGEDVKEAKATDMNTPWLSNDCIHQQNVTSYDVKEMSRLRQQMHRFTAARTPATTQ